MTPDEMCKCGHVAFDHRDYADACYAYVWLSDTGERGLCACEKFVKA